jgi:hypothetical protein
MTRARRWVIAVLAIASCTGNAEPEPIPVEQNGCRPVEKLVGVGEMAAGVATSCASPYIEVDGVAYGPGGCHAVDASFLGSYIARGEKYTARSIDDSLDIAMADRQTETGFGKRCGGWQVWQRRTNTDKEEKQALRLICRVRPDDIPVVPRWCKDKNVETDDSMQ